MARRSRGRRGRSSRPRSGGGGYRRSGMGSVIKWILILAAISFGVIFFVKKDKRPKWLQWIPEMKTKTAGDITPEVKTI